ncbi:IDEAL domain-containing protein [Solibacillus sp. MA9]|uniref:IDEAL domain-containing protein n=1 Tax=Solibacillus palustris TaxID=2908203 RepID=A0ABS9U8M0_9BACL|nr:IDEAL domain-containing protein [Solibacillus sp. MA9]MCH7320669.1 IDEAL domain-containing protein [Solibacillus sp. MA9]
MDKYYSYTDFLKAVGHQPTENQAEKLLGEIYLDLFISRIQRIYRIEQLKTLIDNSLDQKNQRDFYTYASELKMLMEAPIS